MISCDPYVDEGWLGQHSLLTILTIRARGHILHFLVGFPALHSSLLQLVASAVSFKAEADVCGQVCKIPLNYAAVLNIITTIVIIDETKRIQFHSFMWQC